jgi:hypothetical protein
MDQIWIKFDQDPSDDIVTQYARPGLQAASIEELDVPGRTEGEEAWGDAEDPCDLL